MYLEIFIIMFLLYFSVAIHCVLIELRNIRGFLINFDEDELLNEFIKNGNNKMAIKRYRTLTKSTLSEAYQYVNKNNEK